MSAPAPARVLVVEDDPHLAAGVSENLRAEGYEVDAPPMASRRSPGCGANSCGLDRAGRDAARDRRLCACAARCATQGNNTPVLFLTARGDPADRVRGLEAGGDDYLAKPFHLQEFLLRVRAILRRWDWYRSASATAATAVLRFGGNEVDFRAFRARAWNGEAQELTEKEAMILEGSGRARRARSSRARICSSASGATTSSPRPAPSTTSSCGCASASSGTRPPAPLPHRVGRRLPLSVGGRAVSATRRCASARAPRRWRCGRRGMSRRCCGAQPGAPAVELVHIKTAGDVSARCRCGRSAAAPSSPARSIRRCSSDVDVAVHSLKDLPTQLEPGTDLAATLARADPRDALVSRDGATLAAAAARRAHRHQQPAPPGVSRARAPGRGAASSCAATCRRASSGCSAATTTPSFSRPPAWRAWGSTEHITELLCRRRIFRRRCRRA